MRMLFQMLATVEAVCQKSTIMLIVKQVYTMVSHTINNCVKTLTKQMALFCLKDYSFWDISEVLCKYEITLGSKKSILLNSLLNHTCICIFIDKCMLLKFVSVSAYKNYYSFIALHFLLLQPSVQVMMIKGGR